MSGKIKELMDSIIRERSKGNPAIEEMTKAKLILKGLNPNKFDQSSEDDPIIIERLYKIAEQFNIKNLSTPGKDFLSASSSLPTEAAIVEDLKAQFMGSEVKLLLFFASPIYDMKQLTLLLNEAFPESILLGCSTAGEIIDGAITSNSVVAMAVSSRIIADAKTAVIEHLSQDVDVEHAFASFEQHFGESTYEMDAVRYVGLILIDGLSQREEQLMDLIGNRTNVIFLGGSAADNQEFLKSFVCTNSGTYTDSAVLALLKLDDLAAFSIVKTQSLRPLDVKLTATKVLESARTVIEFNNQPASQAYAQAVGASSIEEVPDYFVSNPLGLFVGEGNIFIRSPQKLMDTSMMFYCNILEGMEVNLLTSTDIIQDTRSALEEKWRELGRIDGLIQFNCIVRTQELERKKLLPQYAELFKDMPSIGFSTYGEEYIGHTNQTSTMLVFRRLDENHLNAAHSIDDITSDLIEFNLLLDEEITKRIQREEEITYLSYHDTLTGLYNRRFFDESLTRLDHESHLPLCIILADVNSLKIINDAFGHAKGDELLKRAAHAIKSSCRSQDIIARLGGDEFGLLLPNTTLSGAAMIVDRIHFLCTLEKINGLQLSLSLGMDCKSSVEDPIQQVYKNADNEMFKNKSVENGASRGNTIRLILDILNSRNALEDRHSRRVSEICQAFGQALRLSDTEIVALKNAGIMHDIGKIAIEDIILSKPGKLSPMELNALNRHPEIGYRLLSSSYDLLSMADAVLAHHERWDGTGYPKGLTAENIPYAARIIAIADTYEALTSDRPYRKALSTEVAYQEILNHAGTQFDPVLVKIFSDKVYDLVKDL